MSCAHRRTGAGSRVTAAIRARLDGRKPAHASLSDRPVRTRRGERRFFAVIAIVSAVFTGAGGIALAYLSLSASGAAQANGETLSTPNGLAAGTVTATSVPLSWSDSARTQHAKREVPRLSVHRLLLHPHGHDLDRWVRHDQLHERAQLAELHRHNGIAKSHIWLRRGCRLQDMDGGQVRGAVREDAQGHDHDHRHLVGQPFDHRPGRYVHRHSVLFLRHADRVGHLHNQEAHRSKDFLHYEHIQDAVERQGDVYANDGAHHHGVALHRQGHISRQRYVWIVERNVDSERGRCTDSHLRRSGGERDDDERYVGQLHGRERGDVPHLRSAHVLVW